MVWLPFAYWFAPYWLARNSLRGLLKNHGIDIQFLPLPLTQELADNAVRIQKYLSPSKSVITNLYDLQLSLDTIALQVWSVLYEQDRSMAWLGDCHRIRDTMVKHGINAPEIITPDKNKR